MFFFYDYVIRIYILVLNLTEYLLRNVLYVGLLQNSNMFLCKIKIQPNSRVQNATIETRSDDTSVIGLKTVKCQQRTGNLF